MPVDHPSFWYGNHRQTVRVARLSASVSSPSLTGWAKTLLTPTNRPSRWASPQAIWTAWLTATPPIDAFAVTMPTRQTMPDKRPDRAAVVYSQRCREALSRCAHYFGRDWRFAAPCIAHYDYWSDKVRRSILMDSRADILLYGNAERRLSMLYMHLPKVTVWRPCQSAAPRIYRHKPKTLATRYDRNRQ